MSGNPVPPCGTRCDRREVGCHGSCEAWAKYEAQRNAEYERVAKAVHDTDIVEAGKWRGVEQAMRRKIGKEWRR